MLLGDVALKKRNFGVWLSADEGRESAVLEPAQKRSYHRERQFDTHLMSEF